MPNTNQQGTPLPCSTFEQIYNDLSVLSAVAVRALAASLIHAHHKFDWPELKLKLIPEILIAVSEKED